MSNPDLMEKIVSLCKRRGFIFPGSEIYGGLANSWDYGPLGVELKNNIKALWWQRFVHQRDDIVGLDAALIMNTKVWEASGHLGAFKDALSECKNCHNRIRIDDYLDASTISDINSKAKKSLEEGTYAAEIHNIQKEIGDKLNQSVDCPVCKKRQWTEGKQFGLMMQTYLGATQKTDDIVYFRPETAQAMFVNFKNILDTTRKTIPFGIAQIGKAFRNEITPGNFIFRTREFEQMEIEYFIRAEDWEKYFAHWQDQMKQWMQDLGLDLNHVHEIEIPDGERAHYSKRTIDFEYDFPFGQKELYGLAYRTDFDLQNHQKASGQNLEYRDPFTNEVFVPHVIEPTWGVDRSMLAMLCEAYQEEGEGDSKRVYLRLPAKLAPYKVAVFPLLKNKPELVAKAKDIYDSLRQSFTTIWDDRGNVGKRYYSQDEIGTPYCVTVDFQTLEDNTVTVRHRDTTQQERIAISELPNYLTANIYG
jgi:glycyl-tRNA synthetase